MHRSQVLKQMGMSVSDAQVYTDTILPVRHTLHMYGGFCREGWDVYQDTPPSKTHPKGIFIHSVYIYV